MKIFGYFAIAFLLALLAAGCSARKEREATARAQCDQGRQSACIDYQHMLAARSRVGAAILLGSMMRR